MIGLAEEQLWQMTPRTFHNLLQGKLEKEQAERKIADLKHQELVLAMLSPHMKKADRDRAYNNLYAQSGTPKKTTKKRMTPEEVKAFLADQNKQ